jgi:hypothetical protein
MGLYLGLASPTSPHVYPTSVRVLRSKVVLRMNYDADRPPSPDRRLRSLRWRGSSSPCRSLTVSRVYEELETFPDGRR